MLSPLCALAAPAMLSCKIDLDFERCAIRLAEDSAGSEKESSEEATERLARALDKANTLVRQSPTARNHGIRGLALMELGRPLQALDDFDAAVELQPTWRLHLMRSICHRRLLDHESTRDDLSAALRLTPPEDTAIAFALAGGLLSKWGYHDLAGKCLNHACRLQPGATELFYLRGHCSLAAGAYRDALLDPRRVLEDEATAAHGFDLMCQAVIVMRAPRSRSSPQAAENRVYRVSEQQRDHLQAGVFSR